MDLGTRVFWLLIAALLGASAFFAANVLVAPRVTGGEPSPGAITPRGE